jgi:hypothetical protein
MNRSRIVISATRPELETPHFDDEATIVTARPVVPIAEAKAGERSRLSVLIVAGLVAATMAGAAGALGINFFQNRQRSSFTAGNQPQVNPDVPTTVPPVQTSESPIPPAEQSAPPITTSESTSAATEALTSETPASADDQIVSSSAGKADQNPRDESSTDPAHLVRKRRVHAVKERLAPLMPANRPPRRPRGAGRIIEIFEGPQ